MTISILLFLFIPEYNWALPFFIVLAILILVGEGSENAKAYRLDFFRLRENKKQSILVICLVITILVYDISKIPSDDISSVIIVELANNIIFVLILLSVVFIQL